MPRAALALLFCALAAPAADDARYFPAKDRVTVQPIADHILGPTLPPGGTLAYYHGAKKNYELILIHLPTPEKAAFFLLDVKKAMTNPKYLPNLGGFQSFKDSEPFYAFAKGPYLAAVINLDPDAADPIGPNIRRPHPVTIVPFGSRSARSVPMMIQIMFHFWQRP